MVVSFCDTEVNISPCEWILWMDQPVWTLNQILHFTQNYSMGGLSNNLHIITEAEIHIAECKA